MATKNKNTIKISSVVTILLSIALVAAIVFGILVMFREQNSEPVEETEHDTNTAVLYTDDGKDDDVDSAFDEKDAYDAENNKEVERDESGKKIANVFVTINQNDELVIVSGRVVNFVEEDGKCTYIVSNGTEEKVFEKGVLPDPKATVCEAVPIKKEEMNGDNWSVIIKYKSNDAEGESEKQDFSIW